MESGRLGKIDIGGVQLLGMATWNHSGGSRRIIEAPETFDAEYVEKLPGIIEGGEIEVTGVLKIGDPGLDLLIAKFIAGTTYIHDGIKFHVNSTDFYTPEEALTPPSNCWMSKKPDAVNHEASGICAVSMTFVVSGQLELVAP